MNAPSRSRWPLLLAGLLVLAAGGGFAAWWFWPERALPKPGEARYEEFVEAFEVGTAALDSGLNDRAETELTRAIDLVPGEPAAWANRGLLYLRGGTEWAKVESDLAQASKLAPGHASIEELWSLLKERQGKLDEAISHIEAALKQTPDDPLRLYRLTQLVEMQNEPDADQRRLDILSRILSRRPTSLPVLGARLALAIRANDPTALRDTFARLEPLVPHWTEATKAEYVTLKQALADSLPRDEIQFATRRFGNVLKAEFGYARSSNELWPPIGFVGTALQQFIRLAPARTTPDVPDLELKFEKRDPCKRVENLKSNQWDLALPFWRDGESGVGVLAANGKQLETSDGKAISPRLNPLTGLKKDLKLLTQTVFGTRKPTANNVLAIDLDNDRRTDVVLAGENGLAILAQNERGEFERIAQKSQFPNAIEHGSYFGAWAADLDSDGDLDILLAPLKGPPILLLNNANGTFTPRAIFAGVVSPRAFVWADLDNDGASDAVLLDADGRLHVFLNERGGQFRKIDVDGGRYLAVTVADLSDNGRFDLVALGTDDKLVRLNTDDGKSWKTHEIARVKLDLPATPGECGLQAIDLDGNGAIDLVLRSSAGGVAWLADGKGGFAQLADRIPPGLSAVFPTEDGELEALAIENGKPVCYFVKRTKGYHVISFRLRADTGSGVDADQRINSFGIGSELETRSGSLVAKQLVTQPVVSAGLGRRKQLNVARIVWANGSTQYEFDKPANEPIVIAQRLKGSCPFLFTWDGTKMVFVTDFCWSTPLGLYINAQKRDGVMQTTEWLKLPGRLLAPRDGVYDVRVNANLWETHFLDQLALMVVDHPPDTEMHVDERFFLTPTPPRIYLTTPSRPVAKALDHNGKDVAEIVAERDGKYLASAGLGKYQGMTRDHWVTIETGDVPGDGPVYLLANGWLQPTDSSLNVAIEQRNEDRPNPLTLEVPDGKGGWKQVGPPLGFPPGKNKTMVIRLDGIAGPGLPKQVRLRTNMEIYWDSLRVARGLDEKRCATNTLTPTKADLSFRGVVRMTRANRFSPEIPHYDQVIDRGQRWRDLIGYHTRFGDVRELVEKIDDRYAMMNAGDELRLTFAAPDAPKAGWKRDFVWISDGWTKDGDLNTRFSKTVLPLPSHDMKQYDTPPGRLEDDPVYRRHRKDWEVYHTRYVTPAVFEMGLRAYRLGRAER